MSFASPPIVPVDRALEAALRARVDGKAKPPGSLGRIEDLAVRLGLIQNTLSPNADRAAAYVFAGDHGLTQEGVSAYPAAVTVAMVQTFLSGRASVNAFARACDVTVKVVDAGVDADLTAHPDLIDAKVRKGSRNAAVEPALTHAEVNQALERGAHIAMAADCDVLILGEMGIGNTAASSLIMHRLAPAPLDACIGVGTGHDEGGLARKRAAIERAAARANATDPLEVLLQFAGLEIVMMAGAVLGGAASRKAVVIDGFISSAAALSAIRIAPEAGAYCLFAHCSAEKGHRLLLEAAGGQPILDLGLRLGEGTGGVLVAPILRAAAGLMTDVASLAEILGSSER